MVSTFWLRRSYFTHIKLQLFLPPIHPTNIQPLYSTLKSSPVPRINTIPEEILSKIFLSREPPSINLWPFSEQQQKWYAVAAVCRHWRQVSLDTPRLWASINWYNVARAEEAFERSKSAPLDLYLDGHLNRSDRRWALAKTLADSSRIHDILVSSFTPEEFARFLSPFSKAIAPRLESLSFSGIRHSYDIDPCVIPSAMIWQEMPVLRTLDLHGVFVPAPLPNFATLSKFNVASPLLTVGWLLEALRNMPNVNHVEAKTLSDKPNYPPGITSGPCAEEPQIVLPSLCHLDVSIVDLRQARILQSIGFPKTLDLHLLARSDSPPSPQTAPCDFAVIRNAWASLKESLSSRTHIIDITYSGIFVLEVSTKRRKKYIIKFTYLDRPSLSTTPAYVRLCQSLPLSAATVLTITIASEYAEAWRSIFPSFINVTRLQVSDFETDALLDVLYNADPSTAPFVFPRLEVIQIDYEAEFSTVQFERLKTIVEQRDDYGERIDSFVLTNAKIPGDMWKYFEKRNEDMDGWTETITWELMDRYRYAFDSF
ncbi:hypothetical protein ONZ45_g8450 [Pleurotus djamor]|nr:hypothetical protein ONZ45_g8450 [Pleurotus djamor]